MKRLQELKNTLISRKYQISLIESGINKALNIPKDILMQVKTHSKENTIPYVSTFNPNNAEMLAYSQITYFRIDLDFFKGQINPMDILNIV